MGHLSTSAQRIWKKIGPVLLCFYVLTTGRTYKKSVAVAVVAQRRPVRGAAGTVITSGLDDPCLLYQSENSYAGSTYIAGDWTPSDWYLFFLRRFEWRWWRPSICGRWILGVYWTLLNHVCMVQYGVRLLDGDTNHLVLHQIACLGQIQTPEMNFVRS